MTQSGRVVSPFVMLFFIVCTSTHRYVACRNSGVVDEAETVIENDRINAEECLERLMSIVLDAIRNQSQELQQQQSELAEIRREQQDQRNKHRHIRQQLDTTRTSFSQEQGTRNSLERSLRDQNQQQQTALRLLQQQHSELADFRREQQVQRDENRLIREQLNTTCTQSMKQSTGNSL